MHDLILKSGEVLTNDGIERLDIAISGGVVTHLGSVDGDATETIDCSGSWVGPAFVDLHTHLREPGQEWKEDIASGSRAAAAGGFGAIVAMPNTDPPIDSGHLARFVRDRGVEVGLVDVIPSGCITLDRAGVSMSHIDDLWAAGVRIFTDDGDSVTNAAVLRTAMEYIAALGGVISQHAIDRDLSGAGYMHEGAVSSRLGIYGIPREADDITIARDIALAELTGVRYHVQHLSTARAVEMIATAKDRGLAVTAEVSPHHLAFDHSAVATADPDYKMMPPLRDPDDRAALVAGVRSGVIDAIATDHAPHAALEKEVPFEEAPNGVLGLEWAASVAIGSAKLDQRSLFDRMSIRPAAIAGLGDHGKAICVGADASIVVVDPTEVWTATSSYSRSRNAPYFGMDLTGRVQATILRGKVTHRLGSGDRS
jgi:dihydroorotase